MLLADDHRFILDGLRALLESEEGITVVGTTEDGHEAVRLVRELTPHVVVIDLSMPSLDGIEATRQIKAVRPTTQVVVLTGLADERTASRALEAGALGYVAKDAATDELPRAIRAVADRKAFLSPGVAGNLLGR
ncbi:MAG TPA: response regulator transcription factor [Myxococcaceae bacterium]